MNKDFKNFLEIINNLTFEKSISFANASKSLQEYINKLSKNSIINIVKEIGMIPEEIEASSSSEKLFSKASDCILARCFSEFGMPSIAVNERGNSADIIAKSIHGYTLVADAKTFRLSRTAKNQKDFKISTLSNWRGSEHNYALLIAPYFQYPSTTSQIYSSALDNQVCLLSWEHILFLLKNNIQENQFLSLEAIWEAPARLSRDKTLLYKDRMNCQLKFIDKILCERISKNIEDFYTELELCIQNICARGNNELLFLNKEKEIIENLTREQAIQKLLKSEKINERISTIEKFISFIKRM